MSGSYYAKSSSSSPVSTTLFHAELMADFSGSSEGIAAPGPSSFYIYALASNFLYVSPRPWKSPLSWRNRGLKHRRPPTVYLALPGLYFPFNLYRSSMFGSKSALITRRYIYARASKFRNICSWRWIIRRLNHL